jgi:hypothetical protein
MGLLSKAAGKTTGPGYANDSPQPGGPKGPRGGPGPETPGRPFAAWAPLEGLPGDLKNEIIKYHRTYTLIHGMVLAYPPGYDETREGESFIRQLNRITATLGSAVPLPSGHSLLLFSNTLDPELLAHRLAGTLETETAALFQTDDIQTLTDYIRPYL